MSLATMQGKLSRAEMKNIMAGLFDDGIVLCGGEGNSVQKCHCVGSTTVFYCCNNTLETCVQTNGCSSYVCAKNTPPASV